MLSSVDARCSCSASSANISGESSIRSVAGPRPLSPRSICDKPASRRDVVMRWLKKGLIYGPSEDSWWAQRWALQPTPLLRADGTIRVFAGFRTFEGVSRVGFVDVSAENPAEVLAVSREPVLDIGVPGAFDENGVVPCAVVERDGKLYLYYAGYQLGQKVKFVAYGGLAIS